jgi:hypothetical protein
MQPGGGSGGSNEGAMKSPPPQRRLVLEILMSPSGKLQNWKLCCNNVKDLLWKVEF